MTEQTIKAIDAHFYRTRRTLPTKSWTIAKFIRTYSKYFPYLATIDTKDLQSRMKLVMAYTDLNKILRKRGLTIKSRNYYSSFYILPDASTKVQRQRTTVSRITASANDLNQGIFSYGSQYSARLSANEIETFSNEASFRYGR